VNVLVYLTSLGSLIDVIIKFVSLAAICKFDDMYAAALSENKMRKAGGAKLRKYFYRRMRYMMKEYTELKNAGEHAESIDTQPLKEFNCEEPERCVRPIGSLDRH